MFAKCQHFDDREIKCSRNVQILPLVKFAKINVGENLYSQKLMFAKYNALKSAHPGLNGFCCFIKKYLSWFYTHEIGKLQYNKYLRCRIFSTRAIRTWSCRSIFLVPLTGELHTKCNITCHHRNR